jgi:beta-glucanase (GH16 family)
LRHHLRRGALAILAALLVVPAFVGASAPAASAGDAVYAIAPPCGGVVIAKTTGGYWTCSFSDDFNGTALDTTKWAVQETALSGFRSGPACYVKTPTSTFVSGGYLHVVARKTLAPFVCRSPFGDFTTQYSSGSVSTFARFAQAYGRFEVRAKLPAAKVKGLQEAFWLWPVDSVKYGNSWPASGEIDIAEVYSALPDRAIPFIHYNAAAYDAAVTNNYCMITDITKLHTYAVEWTPTAIEVIYDGHTCLVDHWQAAAPLVGSQPFDQPFMIALTQALGVGDNAFVPGTTPLPADTAIDYVRIWK